MGVKTVVPCVLRNYTAILWQSDSSREDTNAWWSGLCLTQAERCHLTPCLSCRWLAVWTPLLVTNMLVRRFVFVSFYHSHLSINFSNSSHKCVLISLPLKKSPSSLLKGCHIGDDPSYAKPQITTAQKIRSHVSRQQDTKCSRADARHDGYVNVFKRNILQSTKIEFYYSVRPVPACTQFITDFFIPLL